MSEALGLSIGTTNLAAARPGRPPVSRRSVLTLWDDRPAEVGVPSQNPDLTSPDLTQAGLVLRGFVERVGDPVPLVAADGSAHLGANLTATALEAMARTVDDGTAPAIVVAAPAHWGPAAVGMLRAAMRTSPALSPAGIPPTIVSDATAALAALQARPGFPNRGVVALCDFGASGSSITLADAGAGLAPIGETVRFADFSGDLIDQALLNQVLASARAADHLDPAATAAVGSLARLRGECRLAKERLSSEADTVLTADLPGYRSEVLLTRADLDPLIAEPFTAFLDALGDVLEYNRIPAVNLAAVATVGGGAAIPAITQRLSADLRVPVLTTPTPWSTAAEGATLFAGPGYGVQGTTPDSPTGLAPVPADSPTGLAPSAWATGTASDGSPSATYRALAWSEDDDAGKEPVPYTGEDYHSPQAPTSARPMVELEPEYAGSVVPDAPLPWYRRPPLLFGIAAAVAAVAVGGLAITLTSSHGTPTTTTTRVTKPGEPAASTSVTPQTITVTGGNGETTVTTVTPPPTSSPSGNDETTTTPSTTTPTTTTTTPTTTTTTTTTPTTTTTTTTTTPTTTTTTAITTTTTQPPPTTTQPPPTTTQPPPPTTTVAPPPTTTVAPPPTTTVAPAPTTHGFEIPTLRPAPAR